VTADAPLAIFQRRRARSLGYLNGAVWALGNGLASSTLVVYLAMDLGPEKIGLGVGMILATRHLVGVLRLGAPAVIGRYVDRKRFCLGAFLLSAAVLAALPLVAAPGVLATDRGSLAALVGLWCGYHLLQYLGTIALWSWLADLVPLRIRGRFIGRRERWMVAGGAVGAIACGVFTWWWKSVHLKPQWWIGYAISAGVGACLMVAALVPLTRIPRLSRSQTVRHGATLRATLAPFVDARFLRLVAFGCWFSFFNGVSQSAQGIYPYRALGLGLFVMLGMGTTMRIGQLICSPYLGRLADRLGNRPVMVGSMLLVAQGPLFYLAATSDYPGWIGGAWTLWIAYAGLNVCLPNLMLKLSPGESNTPYIAAYFTITGLCYAASTILGGYLLDCYSGQAFWPFGASPWNIYQIIFLIGWIGRTLAVPVLLLVIEPKASHQGPHAPNRAE